MARKVRTAFLYVVASVFFCAFLYHHYLRDALSDISADRIPPSASVITISSASNFVLRENITDGDDVDVPPDITPIASPSPPPPTTEGTNTNTIAATPILLPDSPPPPMTEKADTKTIATTSILLPDWEVLVIVSPDDQASNLDGKYNYSCVFDTGEVSPANFSGVLHFPDRSTFSCTMPMRARRRLPFKQPVLLLSESPSLAPDSPPPPPLLRWSYIVYDSLTTEDDVVLFVKGVNIRQGTNRSPTEFRCVFGENNAVRSAVTSSMQEVFRCNRPDPPANFGVEPVKISLEIVKENIVIPSVAYYSPPRTLPPGQAKSLICAATMVYDVGKFLQEWVIYHSSIGVDRFLLYDNDSDDDLAASVDELLREGFDISIYPWRWPKTQEAGFSHSAIYAKNACKWVIYIDVDEFVFSPTWHNLSTPSKSLLRSMLPKTSSKTAQISIGCHEFGPSGQETHPAAGVTQGYNCRRQYENRHKSIVLLEAVDPSLLNAIHHFYLRSGRRTKKPGSHDAVVNHYKYQAWPEFKAKFRRRVSAYVLDWTKKMNPKSNDRTPGLGFSAVEPKGWTKKFCETHDNRLRDLARKWFGLESESGFRMAWER